MKLHHELGRILGACLLLAAIAVCGAPPPPAAAASIGFDPGVQSSTLGATAQVDVAFYGLGGEIVSAYDLDITYDPLVLDAIGVIFSNALGDPLFFEVLSDFDVSSAGIVDLAQLSLLPDTALAGLQQGDPVVTATLLFDTVGVGTSPLDFVFDAVNDVKGRNGAVLALAGGGASITVVAAIPEPSAALLFGLGAAVVGPALRRGAAVR